MARSLHPGLYQFGVVVKAHGTRGGLLIEVDDPDIPTDQLKVVYLRSSEKQWVPYRVTEIRSHFDRRRNMFFVILEGINTRTQAVSLRGKTVMSDHDMVPVKDHRISMIGYRVVRDDGSVLGIVSDILETSEYNVFVVQMDQKQVLIPRVDEYVWSVCDVTEKVFVQNTADLETLE